MELGLELEVDEDQFYDTREDLSSVSDDEGFDYCLESCSGAGAGDYVSRFNFSINSLESVRDRRFSFLRWIGLEYDSNSIEGVDDPSCGVDRITSTSGAVLRTVEGVSSISSQIVLDSLSNEGSRLLENRGDGNEDLTCMIKNLDDGTRYVVDELDQEGKLNTLRVLGSNQLISLEEFHKNIGPSSFVRRHLQREAESSRLLSVAKKKMKRGWLSKLDSITCFYPNQGFDETCCKDFVSRIQRVRVNLHKKRVKELSCLYTEQEFKAHKGVILTMKFSLDGRYLASGGEDGIVRVWKVVEDVRTNEMNILDDDPSSIYFKMNQFTGIVAPLDVDKENLVKTEKLKKSSSSTCVIIPPKTFRILAKPMHEFQGHSNDILDLAWSKSGFLLSSSLDKTARLWQVGIDKCLRVFSHNNYVTCVNFNPVNDNFFISGSIDGKVRIWEVVRCRVVDYIDIREIVTAVCFRPDGQGTIVGTMAGNCRFYDILDSHMKMDTKMSLQGKKKTSGKRITGFQFSPSDPSKLLAASADSHVCILSGVDVIYKFKGLRSAGQMHASFTSDGKHIVSLSEGSNVCIWNHTGQDRNTSKAKKIMSSESFLSHNATIAIPWCGIESTPLSPSLEENLIQRSSLSSPDCFFMSRGFLSELVPRVSATWPEETLLDSGQTVVSPTICKSEYKFLRSACKGMANSHLWGQVIVTAGSDGFIKVYQNYGLPVRV
ncbi:WD repeat-containing protein YMR102C-like [Vicia villosa]|uniref:WD repeat-containing protein YMR102C-like n=1 Tax=Vicia villosa TaxID=3911 RepID=UPI00273AE27A|nr:WD repeat-containing protein YMR102C-like [Vicia villosa]XP_058732161.1 WD repeat-containing protein YMR102C-like [Vicia villosa]